MKKNKRLKNSNGIEFYDPKEERFLLDFDFNQKNILANAMNKNMPVGNFAYTSIPATDMQLFPNILYTQERPALAKRKYIEDIDVWKIVNSPLKGGKLRWTLEALAQGVKIVDELNNVNQYSEGILYYIAKAAFYGKNLCKEVFPGMEISSLREKANDIERDRVKKKNIFFNEVVGAVNEERFKSASDHYDDNQRNDQKYINASSFDEPLIKAMSLYMFDSLDKVTEEDIKHQRNKLLKAFHPDEGEESVKYSQKVNEAYEVLINEIKK